MNKFTPRLEELGARATPSGLDGPRPIVPEGLEFLIAPEPVLSNQVFRLDNQATWLGNQIVSAAGVAESGRWEATVTLVVDLVDQTEDLTIEFLVEIKSADGRMFSAGEFRTMIMAGLTANGCAVAASTGGVNGVDVSQDWKDPTGMPGVHRLKSIDIVVTKATTADGSFASQWQDLKPYVTESVVR